MKKRKLMFLLLTAAVLAAGCGKKEEPMEEQGTVSLEEAVERFPDTYEKESKSGKVRFSCKLVTPEQEGWENPHSVSVEGLQHCDREKAWPVMFARLRLRTRISPRSRLAMQGERCAF